MVICRIDGIKYNLERLDDKELIRLRDNVVQKVKFLMQDLTVLESVVLDRQLLKLPLDYGDE